MTVDNKTETIILRVNSDLKKGLQKLADDDRRKLSDYVRIQLEKLVKKTAKS